MRNSEVLRAARDSLSVENWVQESYFTTSAGRLCMCAHGAVQAQVNPKVRMILALDSVDLAPAARARQARRWSAPAALGAAGLAWRMRERGSDQIWAARPYWISEIDPIYGSVEAHFILGMVGLTVSKNDAENTTFPEIIELFDKAIAVAEMLGV